MENIAVLLTCFNRKEKTINSLKSLYEAEKVYPKKLHVDIYLTDAGNDGTGQAVADLFPGACVLKTTRDVFWNGGMRTSWLEAQKKKYDGFLLLNDDTNVMDNLFAELFNAHQYCIKNFGVSGIYIGSTIDHITRKFTYGGAVLINRITNTYKMLIPNGSHQVCDFGNGNIMFVTEQAVEKIGIFSEKYVHGIADYDYTLTAKRNNVPVLITANYCGECSRDHTNKYDRFKKMNIYKRIKFLNSPLGFAFPDQLTYMKKNFPYRLPFVFTAGWFKVLFPGIYIAINKLR